MAETNKFISKVPDLTVSQSQRQVQKKPFIKQKLAHNDNMDDVMYRVHLRDKNFMKVQNNLQSIDTSFTNVDPAGKFNFEKHIDMVDKFNNKKRHSAALSAKIDHLLPTRQEKEAKERDRMHQKWEQLRRDMHEKINEKHPPMDERSKQIVLKDRMKMIKTMERANEMIEKKYMPRGTAQSLSPFLVANAVKFDSVKILNKMESDRKVRIDRQKQIKKEIEHQKEIAAIHAREQELKEKQY